MTPPVERPHVLRVELVDMQLRWSSSCPYAGSGPRSCALFIEAPECDPASCRLDPSLTGSTPDFAHGHLVDGCQLEALLSDPGMGAGVFLDDGPLRGAMPVRLEWVQDDPEVLLLHHVHALPAADPLPPPTAPDRRPQPIRVLCVANANDGVECGYCEEAIPRRRAIVLAFKGELVIDRWHPACYQQAGARFGEPNEDLHRRPQQDPLGRSRRSS